MTCLVAFTILTFVGSVRGYSSGPPTSVCHSLAPDTSDRGHNAQPLRSNIPYSLKVVNSRNNTYQPEQTLALMLSELGGKTFVGFMVQGRDVNGKPVGSFVPQSEYQQLIHCPGIVGNSIAHYNTAEKHFTYQEFLWTAIGTRESNVTFYYTVVHEMDEYWAFATGPALTFKSNAESLSSTRLIVYLLVAVMCGVVL